MPATNKDGTPRDRCTCRNQQLYYGSYYCDPNPHWCRKEKDVKWWEKLQKRLKKDEDKSAT